MADWKAWVKASDCITKWTLVLGVVPVWLSICLCIARRSAPVNSIPRLSRGVGSHCWSKLALKVTLFTTSRHVRRCPVGVSWNSNRGCLVKIPLNRAGRSLRKRLGPSRARQSPKTRKRRRSAQNRAGQSPWTRKRKRSAPNRARIRQKTIPPGFTSRIRRLKMKHCVALDAAHDWFKKIWSCSLFYL